MSSLFLSCTHEDLDKALDLKKEIKYKIDFYNKDINVSVDSEEADDVLGAMGCSICEYKRLRWDTEAS